MFNFKLACFDITTSKAPSSLDSQESSRPTLQAHTLGPSALSALSLTYLIACDISQCMRNLQKSVHNDDTKSLGYQQCFSIKVSSGCMSFFFRDFCVCVCTADALIFALPTLADSYCCGAMKKMPNQLGRCWEWSVQYLSIYLSIYPSI